MQAAAKGLVFFKIFDLAFFAPGIVIAITGVGLFSSRFTQFRNLELGTAGGILAVLAGIGIVYSVGLAVFSLTWIIYRRFKPRKKPHEFAPVDEGDWPPLPLLFKGETQTELILYFWYLRATCLSLAGSFVISAWCILIFRSGDSFAFGIVIFELLAAFLFVHQALGYGEGVDRSLQARALEAECKCKDRCIGSAGPEREL